MSERGSSLTRVSFDGVVHRFRLIHERRDTLREMFARMFRGTSTYQNFEALKRVSFEIRDGETVGLVGPNGSGKSTILKIIAGVYRPTTGDVRIFGKVAGLIELGAGFHHDLTGRENILLNGLLLGLSRREIKAREQQILDFAELGEFIDSPVKQYSSGMFMRLGFAVATEVDPDILLIDEILAVGDAAFQQKCMARIDEFRERRRTIILVSHDLVAVRRLCQRVLVVQNGRIRADGSAGEILDNYEELLQPVLS